jgi:protein-disulfide isomerase
MDGPAATAKCKGVSRLLLPAIVLGCAGGAWLSGELVKEHAGHVWAPTSDAPGLLAAACGAARELGFDCDAARQNRWAEILLPIPVPSLSSGFSRHTVVVPVAFVGLAYFVFLGVWFACLGRPRPHGAQWHRLPLVVATLGGLTALFFVALMATRMAPWCLQCLGVHALNLVLVGAIWRMVLRPVPGAAVPASSASPTGRQLASLTLTRREIACTVAFALVLIAGLWAYRREQLGFRRQYQALLPYRSFVKSLQRSPDFLLREFYAQPQQDIPLRASETVVVDRPQLVVFTDYQCAACQCHALRLEKEIAAAFAGRLTVSIRHYPLAQACNPGAGSNPHPEACAAAYAAEAARLQGGDEAFRRMHGLLFRYRKQLGPETYRELARRTGLDDAQLLRDMGGTAARDAVAADVELARRLGVTGTPALFLNGRRVPDVCDTPVFWQALAAASQTPAAPRVAAAAADAPDTPPETER